MLVIGRGSGGLLIVAVLRAAGRHRHHRSEPVALRRPTGPGRVGAAGTVVAPDAWRPRPRGRSRGPSPWPSSARAGPSAAEVALDQLDFAGTLVFVGTGHEPPAGQPQPHDRARTEAFGAYNYDDDGFRPALALLASGALPVDLLIEPDDVFWTA